MSGIAYFKKKKWQLKKLIFLSPLKFQYLLKYFHNVQVFFV